MLDLYKKTAVSVISRINNQTGFTLMLTSSCAENLCSEPAKKLTSALLDLKKDAAFLDASTMEFQTLDEAQTAISSALNGHEILVISASNIRGNESAMLIAAASKNILSVERIKASRTDQIDEALEIIKNLNAEAIGFILV